MTLHDDLTAIERRFDRLEREMVERYGNVVHRRRRRDSDDDASPPDLLTVGLVGGTGVGKSTLVNALARDDVSTTSQRRPTTDRIIPYFHRDRENDLVAMRSIRPHLTDDFRGHDIERLRSVFVFDLPDMDSLATRHAEIVRATLPRLDIVVWMTSLTKYNDRIFHEWIATEAPRLAGDNMVFVLNKIDELTESDANAAAARANDLFRDALATTLGRDRAAPRTFTVAARRPEDSLAGNRFRELEDELFRERSTREIMRIKSSNRVALVGRSIDDLGHALRLDLRMTSLREERDFAHDRVREILAQDDVSEDMEGVLQRRGAQDTLANLILDADLERWPLLPRLRLLLLPFRQLLALITRAPALISDRERDPGPPLAAFRTAIHTLNKERRRRASRRDDLPLGDPMRAMSKDDLDTWLDQAPQAVDELAVCTLGRELADTASTTGESRRPGKLRHFLVWLPLLWFPLLQPLAQEAVAPEESGSFFARMFVRLIRITSATHLIVSLFFVAIIYSIYLLVLRLRALRKASRRCRALVRSDLWQEELGRQVEQTLLPDVIDELEEVERQRHEVDALRDAVRDLETRLDDVA